MTNKKDDLVNLEVFREQYKEEYAKLCDYKNIFTAPTYGLEYIQAVLKSAVMLDKIMELDVVDGELLESLIEIKAKELNFFSVSWFLYLLSVNEELGLDINAFLKTCGTIQAAKSVEFICNSEVDLTEEIEKQINDRATLEQKQSLMPKSMGAEQLLALLMGG